MKSSLIIGFLTLMVINAPGQKLQLVDSLKIDEPQRISLDRQNNFYIAYKNGSIKKYSAANELLVEYSPQKSGEVTLIEAWNPLRPFLFYENFQEYIFLNRFLVLDNRYEARLITDYAGLIAPSADNNLWIIDLANFGLKKYNINFNQVVLTTPFDLLLDRNNYEISFMKEYQNMVFIADRQSGILVFDNLGNYLSTLPHRDVDYFCFLNDEIYFLANNMLVFQDIYNAEKKHMIDIKQSARFALMVDGKLKLFTNKQLKTYKIIK